MQPPIDWLLAGEPWIAYRTRRELLHEPPTAPAVTAARIAMLANPQVCQLLAELAAWPGTVIASHKSAGQPFHKLTFAADLGLCVDDPPVAAIAAAILQHQDPEGPFTLPMPADAARLDSQQWGWALCDAPLLVYALVKFGLAHDPAVARALTYLVALQRANGWPCAVAATLGSFRGPGRKDDPCPFANLAMLKTLGAHDDWRDSAPAHTGTETSLVLWDASATRHPYQFYMGTDFRKLKVPLVWYDLVHVLDVLSRFPWLRTDPRLLAMLTVLTQKMDAEGRFTLESASQAWQDWEFGQKRTPSRWLTLTAWCSIQRIAGET